MIEGSELNVTYAIFFVDEDIIGNLNHELKDKNRYCGTRYCRGKWPA